LKRVLLTLADKERVLGFTGVPDAICNFYILTSDMQDKNRNITKWAMLISVNNVKNTLNVWFLPMSEIAKQAENH